MKKVNSGSKLMPQHIPKPPRLGTAYMRQKRQNKNDDDVLKSLEPIDYSNHGTRNYTTNQSKDF